MTPKIRSKMAKYDRKITIKTSKRANIATNAITSKAPWSQPQTSHKQKCFWTLCRSDYVILRSGCTEESARKRTECNQHKRRLGNFLCWRNSGGFGQVFRNVRKPGRAVELLPLRTGRREGLLQPGTGRTKEAHPKPNSNKEQEQKQRVAPRPCRCGPKKTQRTKKKAQDEEAKKAAEVKKKEDGTELKENKKKTMTKTKMSKKFRERKTKKRNASQWMTIQPMKWRQHWR